MNLNESHLLLSNPNKSPLFSIVITSYTLDRLKDTLELLDSIKAQTYPCIETIFVAERSRELAEQIKAYSEREAIPNMKVLFNNGEPGASAARNLGIKEAKGDIIAFIDDDALASPDWAEEMVKTYQDDSVIGVTGAVLPLWEGNSMCWFPEEFYWIISCTGWGKWAEVTEVRSVWTMNGSFKREAFDAGEFFSTALGPRGGKKGGWRRLSEEVDLSMRIKIKTGKRILFNPKVKVRHKVYKYRLRCRYIKECAYWIGLSRYILKKLYPSSDRGTNVLSTEHQLLKRIFTKLLLSIFKSFFRNPVIAWRKFLVTFTALFFVTLGYYSYLLPKNFQK